MHLNKLAIWRYLALLTASSFYLIRIIKGLYKNFDFFTYIYLEVNMNLNPIVRRK